VNGFNLLSVQMGSQSGTHVDAPFHFNDETERIDELDLQLFVGRGVIIDLRGITPRSPDHLVANRSSSFQAKTGDIVIFHIGFSRFWQTAEYLTTRF
jgi:kynurenine formamidase